MRVSIKHRDFIVLDGFLPRAHLDRIDRYFQREALLTPVAMNATSAWSINDGQPLSAQSVLFEIGRDGTVKRPRRPAGADYLTYPSRCAIDLFIPRLAAQLGHYQYLIGSLGKHWKSASATPFAYPPQTSLEWHDDGDGYTGAYVFYAHRAWKLTWGGELLIEDKRGVGSGVFVAPTPNRLVVIRGGTPHKIARVSLLAGEHFRLSLAGFFRREGMP